MIDQQQLAPTQTGSENVWIIDERHYMYFATQEEKDQRRWIVSIKRVRSIAERWCIAYGHKIGPALGYGKSGYQFQTEGTSPSDD